MESSDKKTIIGKTKPIEINKSKGVTRPKALNLLRNSALDNFFLSGIPSVVSIF